MSQVECYFCSEKIKLENDRYGLLLRQGNENFQLLKSFLCKSCDRSMGDDDIREEIREILTERTDMLSDVVKDLRKHKVKGFV